MGNSAPGPDPGFALGSVHQKRALVPAVGAANGCVAAAWLEVVLVLQKAVQQGTALRLEQEQGELPAARVPNYRFFFLSPSSLTITFVRN